MCVLFGLFEKRILRNFCRSISFLVMIKLFPKPNCSAYVFIASEKALQLLRWWQEN